MTDPTTVISLVQPPEPAPWSRAKAEDRSWRLVIFVPGESARNHVLRAERDDDAAAQLEANQLLGFEAEWAPAPKGYRAVSE